MASQENGIKLFGATITLQGLQQAKEEQNNKESSSPTSNETKARQDYKIIPCPRCKSIETKFCYFNNYNVNQPRHFCKGCQRYWTAGGALRNVPVGAGRRKIKPAGGGGDGFLVDGSNNIDGDLQDGDDHGGTVIDEWQVAATNGGFQHVFTVKRRRTDSGCQT